MAKAMTSGNGATIARIMSAMGATSINDQVNTRARQLFDEAFKKRESFEQCLGYIYAAAVEDMERVRARRRGKVKPEATTAT